MGLSNLSISQNSAMLVSLSKDLQYQVPWTYSYDDLARFGIQPWNQLIHTISLFFLIHKVVRTEKSDRAHLCGQVFSKDNGPVKHFTQQFSNHQFWVIMLLVSLTEQLHSLSRFIIRISVSETILGLRPGHIAVNKQVCSDRLTTHHTACVGIYKVKKL